MLQERDAIKMMQEEKCIKYYFDSKKYTKNEILRIIDMEVAQFPNKKVDYTIELNEYNIFIVTIKFLESQHLKIKKENRLLEALREKFNVRKTYKGYEQYRGTTNNYGKYRTYEPI